MARNFRSVHAQCVISDISPEVKIEFLNRNELRYQHDSRTIIVPRETEYSPEGIPTGVAVYLDGIQWSDGSVLSDTEKAELMSNLHDAADLLRVKKFVQYD